MYDVVLISMFAALIVTLTIMVWREIKMHMTDDVADALKQIAMGAFGGFILGGFVLFGLANAEEIGVVSIVFYQDDACIVDFDSENDLFSDRGDLMPGDTVSWDGESLTLVSQGDETWYEIMDKGEPVAAFLYPEDAAWVKETIER